MFCLVFLRCWVRQLWVFFLLYGCNLMVWKCFLFLENIFRCGSNDGLLNRNICRCFLLVLEVSSNSIFSVLFWSCLVLFIIRQMFCLVIVSCVILVRIVFRFVWLMFRFCVIWCSNEVLLVVVCVEIIMLRIVFLLVLVISVWCSRVLLLFRGLVISSRSWLQWVRWCNWLSIGLCCVGKNLKFGMCGVNGL